MAKKGKDCLGTAKKHLSRYIESKYRNHSDKESLEIARVAASIAVAEELKKKREGKGGRNGKR